MLSHIGKHSLKKISDLLLILNYDMQTFVEKRDASEKT